MSLMGHAKSNYSVGGTKTRSALRSLFGRVNYNYMMRYMIMASFRYDGSSRFAKGNKWGFFPSVSLGWNIANEPFWENLKETVSMFKFRLSYGALGNQNIGLYRYIPTLSYNTHALNYPLMVVKLPWDMPLQLFHPVTSSGKRRCIRISV